MKLILYWHTFMHLKRIQYKQTFEQQSEYYMPEEPVLNAEYLIIFYKAYKCFCFFYQKLYHYLKCRGMMGNIESNCDVCISFVSLQTGAWTMGSMAAALQTHLSLCLKVHHNKMMMIKHQTLLVMNCYLEVNFNLQLIPSQVGFFLIDFF